MRGAAERIEMDRDKSMNTAERIAELIDALPVGDGVPVIFNGSAPRCIGRASADWKRAADALLLANRLSATFLSRADVLGRECVIAHG